MQIDINTETKYLPDILIITSQTMRQVMIRCV